ncbi:hypothetical protein P4O66_000630 [Electrophorus voltai]|uniref:Alkylated DNA repair protein AlkB homologue 8 N-terminal domain-containing protein n=1 Tax=Electrophorus voltai TaxID=2609070 RepID=A0AAD9DWL0_9TELE|nr:hypothetical protein P4O66_000630 [Electrophorus voltai]
MVVDFRRAGRDHFPLAINSSSVEIIKNIKFLGVHLAENLTWTLNTSSITQRAQQRLYFLRKLMEAHLPSPILSTFYRGTVESILSSCIITWFGNCTTFDCKTLQRIAQLTRTGGGSPQSTWRTTEPATGGPAVDLCSGVGYWRRAVDGGRRTSGSGAGRWGLGGGPGALGDCLGGTWFGKWVPARYSQVPLEEPGGGSPLYVEGYLHPGGPLWSSVVDAGAPHLYSAQRALGVLRHHALLHKGVSDTDHHPHVPTDQIRRFLQQYGMVHPGDRMVRDELGIWNGRRQFLMTFQEDGVKDTESVPERVPEGPERGERGEDEWNAVVEEVQEKGQIGAIASNHTPPPQRSGSLSSGQCQDKEVAPAGAPTSSRKRARAGLCTPGEVGKAAKERRASLTEEAAPSVPLSSSTPRKEASPSILCMGTISETSSSETDDSTEGDEDDEEDDGDEDVDIGLRAPAHPGDEDNDDNRLAIRGRTSQHKGSCRHGGPAPAPGPISNGDGRQWGGSLQHGAGSRGPGRDPDSRQDLPGETGSESRRWPAQYGPVLLEGPGGRDPLH